MVKPKQHFKKAIVSGNIIEYREYEFPIIRGIKSRGGRKAGIPKDNQRSEEYRKRSANKSKYELIRLVNSNFSCTGMGDSYKFITLTFRDGAIPDLTDVKRANTEFKKYARKLREVCIKHGRDLRYVSVVEFQDENKRGAVHFHVIMDVPVIPVTKEVAEEWKRNGKLHSDYNVKINHYDMWRHGSVTVKAIREASQERETSNVIETGNIGEYVAGYMIKDFGDPRLKGCKAYSPSQGLTKPKVLYDTEAEREIKGLKKENVVRDCIYRNTYRDSIVRYVKLDKRQTK